jgi:hypothetical protein
MCSSFNGLDEDMMFWRDDELQLASRLDKHYITYLSEKQHLLVLGCARLFEVWPSSSCQHGLVGDAIANPSRILPLSKLRVHLHIVKLSPL